MAGEQTSPSQFDQLMAELDTMAKALPAENDDDADAIAAAAAEGGGSSGGDGDDDDKGGKPDGDADDKAPVAKSFNVTLEDGTTMEAFDGAELIKSLQGQVAAQGDEMVKAMGAMIDMLKKQGEAISRQDALFKSLRSEISTLRGAPAGRKSVVSVNEPPVVAKSLSNEQKQGVPAGEFLVKSQAAFDAGKISGTDLCLIETLINQGKPMPDRFSQAVLG